MNQTLTEVRYIGRKPSFTDRLYGSGLAFEQNQKRAVPAELARKLLRHADSFELAGKKKEPARQEPIDDAGEQEVVADASIQEPVDDTAELLEQAEKKAAEQNDLESQRQDLIDSVNSMTKASLIDFAKSNYRQELNSRDTVASLRAQVAGMIDQFGMV